MKKMTLSISMLAFVGLIIVGATTAFFSDRETSSGNTFSAGTIDLLIGNDSYLMMDGVIEKVDENSWQIQSDIAGDERLFFDFHDIKPGDLGEDTISIRVDTNDAWACMKAEIIESISGGHPNATNPEGHLHEEIQMVFWIDDGDNVFEEDEVVLWEGVVAELFDGGWKAIADTTGSFFDSENLGENGQLLGGEEYYLAKVWCHGELEENRAETGEGSPEERQETGFTCNGAQIGNASQGDSFQVDIEFYAVQSRNNTNFQCELHDGEDQDERISSVTGTGWPDVEKAWMASIRYGNNNPEAGVWEMALKKDGASTPWDQAGKEWGESPTGELDFELEYDGTTATLSVSGIEVQSDEISGANGLIGIVAKTNAADGEDGVVTISDIKIDGVAPIGPTGFVTQGTDAPARGLENMVINNVSGPFTLTGKFQFEWGSSPNMEGPSFEIYIENQI